MTMILESFDTAETPFSFVVAVDDDNFRLPTPQYLWDDTTPAVYDYYVDWGDGSEIDHITSWNQSEADHEYTGLTGNYTISITGRMDLFRFGPYGPSTTAAKLIEFLSWGDVGILEFLDTFYDCVNMSYSATDAPVLDTGALDAYSLSEMFYNVASVAGSCTGSFAAWDVSPITQFSYMFAECAYDPTGIDVWDMSAAEDCYRMFENAMNFNQDISGWEPIECSDFRYILNGATAWSDANYDALLLAWSALTWTNTGLTFECEAQYTESAARAVLTGAPNNWTINDGGAA